MGDKKRALVVGIDHYPEPYSLEGCVGDATKVANALQKNTDGSPNLDVRLLVSEDVETVVKAKLKREIEQLFSDSPDIALLYFAGHGFLTTYGGYLACSDAQAYDEGVSMDEILIMANNSQARHRIIVLDCCHSGQMAKPTIHLGKSGDISDGVTILTSSGAAELSYEESQGGVFTSLFIDALEGQCADLLGNVLPSNIYAFIDRSLGAWGQRPIFKTNVSSFVSLRKAEPAIGRETLRNITTYFESPKSYFDLDPTYEFTEKQQRPRHVSIFKELQKMVSVGLVKPNGEAHMYHAAIHSKSCSLTMLGKRYWHLVKEERL